MLTNDDLDRIADRETTWHPLATDDDPPLVLLSKNERDALVGELRAERTRTQDLRKKFVNAASWWHTTHEATEGRWDDCVNWICQDARGALSAGDET